MIHSLDRKDATSAAGTRLGRGQVDVRLVASSTVPKAAAAAWLPLFDEEERARHRRYVAPAAGNLFLLGRAMLRVCLTEVTGVPVRHWRFAVDGCGRPVIDRPAACRRLNFSLSHSHGQILCATAWDRPIGADIEWINRPIDILRMASGLFAPAEAAYVAEATGRRRIRRFYALWTLKEAYVKALSRGLAIPLNSFVVDRSCRRICLMPVDGSVPAPGRHWQFHELAPMRAHQAALAIAAESGEDIAIRWRRIRIGAPESSDAVPSAAPPASSALRMM